MYATCLFCTGALGQNEAIEPFPVGRRLAFDADKGRLWVVCPSCQRWNLTPIEERWEAIESCERLFRDERIRVQTDNIGLAKLREGTELVRIGRVMRPEFAAWRYGRVFGTRLRRRAMLLGGSGAVAAGALIATGAPALIAFAAMTAPGIIALAQLATLMGLGTWGRLAATRVVGQDEKILRVSRADLEETQLLGDEGGDPWRVRLRHSYGKQELTGERARRALGAILARVNRGGAGSGTVADATSIVADAGAPEIAAAKIAKGARQLSGDYAERLAAFRRGDHMMRWKKPAGVSQREWLSKNQEPWNRGSIPRLPRAQRLALEMALHEDSERAALEGELALLQAAWREAEEIANIADGILTPLPPARTG